MFSLIQSQNTLPYAPMQVSVTGNSVTYKGTTSNINITVTPSTAVFKVLNANKNPVKIGKGSTTVSIDDDLQISLNAGSGAYDIVPSGDSNYNYYIGTIGGSSLTYNITVSKSTISLSAATTSYTYSGFNTTLGYTINGIGADTTPTVSNITNTNVGSYTATLSTNSSTNYTLGTPSTLSWAITKAVLTVTANSNSMNTGRAVPTLGYTVTGFLGSDTLANAITGTPALATTATSSSGVGTYPISVSVGTLSASNYSFTYVAGTMTVTTAPLTPLSATGNSTTTPYSGSSQTVLVFSGINGTYSGSPGSASATQTNAGAYTIYITGTGSYTGTLSGTLTISKVPLTITANNATMTYGSTLPTFSYGVTGLKGSDTSSVITGTVTYTTTGSSSANIGSYTITPTVTGLSATNYTFTPSNGTLTINAATLTASTTSDSATYDGLLKSRPVLSGINGTYTGSTTASGTNAGSYTTTITGSGNYTGSVIGTLTINAAAASSSSARGTTVYQVYDGTTKTYTVFSGLTGLSYSGLTSASGINAGTYPTTITLSGNYTGTVTGYLVVTQAFGYINFYAGETYPAGYTSTVLFSRFVQSANASYTFTTSVSGPGAGDAYIQPGFGVESRSLATAGFVVTLTATISDPNYSESSATTTITFSAYVPSSGDGGSYDGGGTTTY